LPRSRSSVATNSSPLSGRRGRVIHLLQRPAGTAAAMIGLIGENALAGDVATLTAVVTAEIPRLAERGCHEQPPGVGSIGQVKLTPALVRTEAIEDALDQVLFIRSGADMPDQIVPRQLQDVSEVPLLDQTGRHVANDRIFSPKEMRQLDRRIFGFHASPA